MASLLTTIGLHRVPPNGVQPPSYAATAIIANFLMAHAVLSARGPKVLLGLDHNVSPREDLAKYGEKMVQAGKMTRQQLRRLIRWESAHANAVENFPMFFGSVLMALHAGVPNGTVNGLCLTFTLVRIGHAVAYIVTENVQLSYIRSLFWWAGNFTCFTLLGLAGKQLNA